MRHECNRPILPLIAILFLISGCTPDAKAVLKNYMDALLQGKAEQAYEYLSSSDRKIRSAEDFKREHEAPIVAIIRQKTTYEIVKVEEQGDMATATIKTTMPDMGSVVKDVMGHALKNALAGDAKSDLDKEIAARMSNKELSLKMEEQIINLVREKSGWKVNLGLEKKGKIAQLMKEAEELKANKKLPGALNKYHEVLELDSQMVEAKEASEEMKKDIESFDAKQTYISNIELYDLKSEYYSSYLEDKTPGVEFKLKNKGDRTLKEVEVTVYFKDKDGNVISEEKYYPVLINRYSLGDNKPLKPNYIWQLERGKFYQAKSVPTEWKAGAVSAKIIYLRQSRRYESGLLEAVDATLYWKRLC